MCLVCDVMCVRVMCLVCVREVLVCALYCSDVLVMRVMRFCGYLLFCGILFLVVFCSDVMSV